MEEDHGAEAEEEGDRDHEEGHEGGRGAEAEDGRGREGDHGEDHEEGHEEVRGGEGREDVPGHLVP